MLSSSAAFQASAADTSGIPSKPTSPIVVQSGQTYDFGGRTLDGSNIKDNGLFRCWGQDKVTIKNVTVTNNPRYALLARNCTNATITNFKMTKMANSAGGIRFDIDGISDGLKMDKITGTDVGGQAIEIWNANGFTIGDVRIDRSGGSGLLLDGSKNGTIGTVTGTYNNQGGGYATFRVANSNGPNIRVKKVYSRNSGRGFFSVSKSGGVTIDTVDIASSTSEGIYIQDSTNTKVLSGKVRGTPNCRIRGGSGNSIAADCGGAIQN
ncbi:right-handed parallel beta-helix repeat-containing protein [Uliginosibacterium sp. H3]|uniref:Right-handed parallel beta-helix repeat-containing protein n=1 Tax=Uliginosibacterium silvisoli TaxID=3114758 RepID=A0ABU6JYN0_9RHOO|nr:right-handed parallel beta-helix repeat-containing protein [Uliginosibacterium sp. H3]